MADDLRVALRIQAQTGTSRREIEQLNQQLRRTGREGAAGVNREAIRAGAALQQAGRRGAASFRQVRSDMRAAATDGSSSMVRASREMTSALGEVIQELRELRQVGTRGANELERELRGTADQGLRPMTQGIERATGGLRQLSRTGGRELGTLKRLAAGVRGEFDRLRHLGGSTAGVLGVAGGTWVAGAQLKASAQRDRDMIRTQQTSGMTVDQRDAAREQLWQVARDYGVDISQLEAGYGTLIASGLTPDEASASIDAIGQATAVTGADASILGEALVAGASAFDIKPGQAGAAQDLLEKMTVAGRLGNAELENLADIFPKIGDKARNAGMSIGEALGFAETLSLVELDPSRLGTLAESTLRIFTNKTYQDTITSETGGAVKFYDDEDNRRSTIDVFRDLKGIYDRLPTDRARGDFLGTVFKGMDQDTLRGVGTLLAGERINQFAASAGNVDKASEVFSQDLQANVESATGTAGRVRATLGQAMDEMMRPINAALADAGSYLLDDLGMDGQDILLGGALAGAGTYGAYRGAGALGGQLLGGVGTIRNIAVGQALEEATGVQSVFVVNWPAPGAMPGRGADMGGGDTSGRRRRPRGGGRPQPSRTGWRSTVSRLGGMADDVAGGAGRNMRGAAPLILIPSAIEAWQIANSDMDDDQRAAAWGGWTGRTGGALTGALAGGMIAGPLGALLGGVIGGIAGDEVGTRLPGWLSPDPVASPEALPPPSVATGDNELVLPSEPSDRWAAPRVATGDNELVLPPGGEELPAPSADDAPTTQPTENPALQAAEARLNALLDKPLVIDIRADADWIHGEIERRADIQLRRGQ